MTSQLARVGADDAHNLSNLNESHIPGYIDRNEAIIHALTEPVTRERINDSEVSHKDLYNDWSWTTRIQRIPATSTKPKESFDTRQSFENPLATLGIISTYNVPSPLPLKFGNSSDKISYVDFSADKVYLVKVEMSSSSSYILANDPSQLSRDVDRWITGSVISTPNESTGVQGGRQTVTQRSTVTSSCMATDNIWYVVAMILPMFSVHNCVMTLRCTPSNMLNLVEIFLLNISRICAKLKVQIQRIARDQVSRDLFATGMDVLLIIYALGFLVLSMYQVTMIS